jgi:hypothetical protein
MTDLNQEMDASVWASEYIRIYPFGCSDEDTMVGWFANAIMSGYDTAMNRKPQGIPEDKKLLIKLMRTSPLGWTHDKIADRMLENWANRQTPMFGEADDAPD